MNSNYFSIMIGLRRTIYFLIYFFDRVFSKKKNRVIILCYHSIGDDDWRFSINVSEFKRQIDYLVRQYEFFPLGKLKQIINGNIKLKNPVMILTFDDGYKDVLKVKDFLKQKGIRPTISVLSNKDKADKKELDNDREFLNNKDLLELKKYGWEIGSHSATHRDFYKISENQIKEEITLSKKILEKELGCEIDYFCYPRGRFTPQILSEVKKAGYEFGLTMDDGFITENTNPLTIPRIGVDRSHNFAEFKTLISPSAIRIRKLIKSTFLKKYL